MTMLLKTSGLVRVMWLILLQLLFSINTKWVGSYVGVSNVDSFDQGG